MSEGTSISVDVKGVPADRRALALAFRRPGGAGGRIAIVVAALAFALAITQGRDALYTNTHLDYPLAATIAAIVGLVLFFAVMAIFARLGRRLANDPRGTFLKGYRLTVGDDGVGLKNENFEAHYRWPGILKIQETPNHAFLYTDGAQAIIVPKRCFPSDADATRFVSLVRAHIAV